MINDILPFNIKIYVLVSVFNHEFRIATKLPKESKGRLVLIRIFIIYFVDKPYISHTYDMKKHAKTLLLYTNHRKNLLLGSTYISISWFFN